MDRGPFSVEWLAQSSRGTAQPGPTARPPRSPPGDASGQESPKTPTPGAEGALPSPGHLAAPSPRRSSPEHGAEAGGGGVPGRPRTKFSAVQLQELERSFREQRYIGASEKRRLAAALNLSQSQIKTWFQNRRMKFKRQTQDARVEALFSGLFLPYHCYPDIVASRYSHGMDVSVSSTSTVTLHPAMPSPALLLPTVPPQSLEPVLPSPGLVVPPSPEFSSYPSVIPTMTVTKDQKRLRFQPYLPSS
ncbi:homeobox protein vex1-like [Dromaius novaehollandiae]|uniref:homeobox protein vex1-like n=1 Tax=Dromaius novaehollandiae TaxID=8790 RepID=UPI00311DBB0E